MHEWELRDNFPDLHSQLVEARGWVYDTLVLFLVPIFGQGYLCRGPDDASRF